MAPVGLKCGLHHITLVHPNLAIPEFEVLFREDRCPLQLIQQILNNRYRKFIRNGYLVQLSVFHSKTTCPIFFLDQQYRAGEGTRVVDYFTPKNLEQRLPSCIERNLSNNRAFRSAHVLNFQRLCAQRYQSTTS